MLRVAFSDPVHLGYGYYFDEDYYDQDCIDLCGYHEDYRNNVNKIKELHNQWDPGESALRSCSNIQLGGKQSFKEGRLLEFAHSQEMMIFFHGRCCVFDHAYYYSDQVHAGHQYYLDIFLEQVPNYYD